MCADESGYAELPGDEGTPPVEDSYKADDTDSTAQEQWHPVEEDDPSLLDRGSRSLAGATVEDGTEARDLSGLSPSGADAEVASDVAAGLIESAAATTVIHPEQTGDWENELSAHRVAVELRRIESDVRAVIEERDPKRKRKLSGTHRWHELEDDILAWRFSGRFEEDTLRRVQELIGRRHYLFRRLRFLASTRPAWNT
jgi:hypothetical protein